MVCGALLAFSSAVPAQTQKGSKTSAHTGDLTGVWYPSSVNTFNFIWTDAQGQHLNALPLTPWAEEKFKGNHPIGGEYTALTSNDPNFACLPPACRTSIPTPIRLKSFKSRAARSCSSNTTTTCARFSPTAGIIRKMRPTWMGDSTGKWEGDTLVVDSTGFNDKTWLDVAGHPHSEALHIVERMRRVDHDTLLIDITLEDPQAYTTVLKTQRKYILKPGWNIMEYICEDTRVKFDEFEKKVGAKGTKTAEATVESGSSQSIVGDWKGTITLADGRSLPAAFSFSASSNGLLTVADPSVSMNLQFRNVAVAAGGIVTGLTSDQVNFLGKLSADGKQMTGDIILPSGTGHKISMSRP